jgi:uncharacterized protein (DUF2235 family)
MKKRLIICGDGTWNWPDRKGSPTNVVKLTRQAPHGQAHQAWDHYRTPPRQRTPRQPAGVPRAVR